LRASACSYATASCDRSRRAPSRYASDASVPTAAQPRLAKASVITAASANWDKAAEHAARCAPYLHHKLAPVDRPVIRKLSEMTNEELEAAAQEAREELQKMTENEGAPVQDAVTKSVHLIA
jgi:hypothetical protein